MAARRIRDVPVRRPKLGKGARSDRKSNRFLGGNRSKLKSTFSKRGKSA